MTPTPQTDLVFPHRRDAFWGAVAAAGALGGGVVLSLWDRLQGTYWWYPETTAYQIWVALLVAAGSVTLAARKKEHQPWIRGMWLVLAAARVSGIVQLSRHVLSDRNAGDLLQNYLAGARRRLAEKPVYDRAGLTQGVNATPWALTLAVPLARLDDSAAIAVSVGVQVAALLLFAGVLAVWQFTGARRPSWTTLAMFFCALPTFFSFQRSWRLGQLDTVLLALLCLALVAAHRPRRDAQVLSASAAALATGLKLAPAVIAVPQFIRAWRGPQSALARRWVLYWGLGCMTLTALSWAALGTDNMVDFARNLPLISQGSTSGNNYALGAQLATWNDRQRRAHNLPLTSGERTGQRAGSLAALAGLLLFSWRRAAAPLCPLMAVWLAGLPLLTPICWDIYFVWCGFLPWMVLWAGLTPSPGQKLLPKNRLLMVLAAGGFLLGGTAGNTTFHHLASGITVQLDLPVWWDSMPIMGHLLTLATLLVSAGDRTFPSAATQAKAGPSLAGQGTDGDSSPRQSSTDCSG